MAYDGWKNSNRRQALPPNWDTLRRRVLERDGYECQWLEQGLPCRAPANQVDHIEPGGPDVMSNLQALCAMHHQAKSSREGAAAYHARRKEIYNRLRKPKEKHPGMP